MNPPLFSVESRKNNLLGELPKNKELGQFVDLRGNLVKNRTGGVFEGKLTPMHTMNTI